MYVAQLSVVSVFSPWLGSFTQGQSSLSFVFTTVAPLTGGGTPRHSQPSVDKELLLSVYQSVSRSACLFAYLLSRNACVEEEVIRLKSVWLMSMSGKFTLIV